MGIFKLILPPHTRTALPTKLIIILKYFGGAEGGEVGLIIKEEKGIKVVCFSSIYLPINGLLTQRAAPLEEPLKAECRHTSPESGYYWLFHHVCFKGTWFRRKDVAFWNAGQGVVMNECMWLFLKDKSNLMLFFKVLWLCKSLSKVVFITPCVRIRSLTSGDTGHLFHIFLDKYWMAKQAYNCMFDTSTSILQ